MLKKLPNKKYSTIGCCGIDCGLCPRFYTEGTSRCPGCAGPNFINKHPSCSMVNCCVGKNGLEVCSECKSFPCEKVDPWLSKLKIQDSFVTHSMIRKNLYEIKKQSVVKFVKQQSQRIKLLKKMIKDFDDGRSKSYFCIASAVMEIPELKKAIEEAKKNSKSLAIKEKSQVLHLILDKIAKNKKYYLKLKK